MTTPAKNGDWWLEALKMASHRVDALFQQGYFQRETAKGHKFVEEDTVRQTTMIWAEWFYAQIADGCKAKEASSG